MKLHSIGFRVKKTEENDSKIRLWKRELSIKKNMIKGYGPPAKPFGVYRETTNYLYMPKFFDHNEPFKDVRNDGKEISLSFNGQLRDKQLQIEKHIMDELDEVQRTILCLKTGYGKCHGINTPIIMYDGTIKKVQDIKVGDQLMGEDSQPRNVLSLGRGRDKMFRIIPSKGDSFIVNSGHILSLKSIKTNDIVDIELNNYLNLDKKEKEQLRLYRVGVDFCKKEILFDPYIMGLYLGNKDSNISNGNSEVIKYLKTTLIQYNMFLHYTGQNYDYEMLPINESLYGNVFTDNFNFNNTKHIPDCYKINTRQIRLELLAGIIDNSGYYSYQDITIIHHDKNLCNDILYLVRSLGLVATMFERGNIIRVVIEGEIGIIPVKIRHLNRNKNKDKKLSVTFDVKELKKDNYYGFTLDGNHRYLLGDFTVTHNTICGLKILCNVNRKTLVVVHTHYLMKQWEERIKEFIPDARIGFFYGQKCDIDDKDIVIGMLQSLSLKDYDPNIFRDIGFTIFDEVHKVGAEQFSKALFRVSSKKMLGLSATPYRGDGLTKILYWHFGKILDPFKEEKLDQSVHVNIIPFEPENFNETRIRYGGYNFANMTNQLIGNGKRNELIIETAVKYVEEGRCILILTSRLEHVRNLASQLDFLGVSVGIFVGGMKMCDLESATEKQVIVATYNMFKEGVDVQKLDTLIFATPINNITQAIGRILRKKHVERHALIVDIWDVVSQYESWGLKRQKYYKSKKFITNMDNITREEIENQNICFDELDLSCSEDEN